MDRSRERKEMMGFVFAIEQLQVRIDALRKEQQQKIYEIREMLLSFPEVSDASAKGGLIKFHFPHDEDGHLSWDCSKSPIDTCVYDIENDPCKDRCLFCGEPYERK